MPRTHAEQRPAPVSPRDAATTEPVRRSPSTRGALLRLQRSHGNRYVQGVVQRKLVVGGADDRHERESDRVARLVVRRPARPDGDPVATPSLTRRPATTGDGALDAGPAQAIDRARGNGRRLPDAVRGPMEQALGADLGGVRVHTDARAHELNGNLQARAFTTGRDIFFRRGDYDPGSRDGRELLAHELTHVVQQGGGAAAQPGGRQVIQRVLTDEARAVLQAANTRQAGFTDLRDRDAVGVLDSALVPQEQVVALMALPPGAPAPIRDFVQAFLLRSFASSIWDRAVELSNSSAETRTKVVRILFESALHLKKTLIRAGYGQPDLTPDLKSAIMYHWYGMDESTWQRDFRGSALDLDVHGVQLPVGGGDLRRIEVCATYVPGRQADALGRAHSFVLYTDGAGKMQYISAHDDGTGTLKAASGVWSPAVFDDKGLKRKVAATGAAAQDAFPLMLEAMQDINGAALEYKMTKQNCNSATRYLLAAAGLGHVPGPSGMTRKFGWSRKLEKRVGRAMPYGATPVAQAPAPAPRTTTTQTPTMQAPATGTTTTWARTTRQGAEKQLAVTGARHRVADPLGPFGGEPSEESLSSVPDETSSEDLGPTTTADDGYVLRRPLAMGAVEIDAGTHVEVVKISTSQEAAHIRYRGHDGYVSLRDLERAIGRRLT